MGLGPSRTAEVVSMLTSRCFLSGFVGVLADGQLFVLWNALLAGPIAYRRLPLIIWLVGLLRLLEDELVSLVSQESADEICPLMFKRVRETGRMLGASWRPALLTLLSDEGRLEELWCVGQRALRLHLQSTHKESQQENRARDINASLDRVAATLADLQGLTSVATPLEPPADDFLELSQEARRGMMPQTQ